VQPWLDDGDVRLFQGDARQVLLGLPDESVQCVITSPPFFNLRDYEDERQIGLEDTPEAWVASLVDVFRECRRVLRPDGVMFVEVGESWAGGGGYAPDAPVNVARQIARANGDNGGAFKIAHDATMRAKAARRVVPEGTKPKDMIGTRWLLAFALRADGWFLRSEIIWAKPNAMPESAKDRPTNAHSSIFVLSRSPRYFWDGDPIRTEYLVDTRKVTTVKAGVGSQQHRDGERWPNPGGANARSVWVVPTGQTSFKHFAPMPDTIAELCMKAGTSEYGACAQCGAPWQRRRDEDGVAIGWDPTCGCGCGVVDPCMVLDPFMGSATTALVARRLGRRAVGVELNPEYLEIAARRLQQLSLFA
jgi:DNA modification methylase